MSVDKLNQNEVSKVNLDLYLKELAKEFKKLNGSKMYVEIILVGGAAVLANYSFRKSTGDVDAIILAPSAMKDAADAVGDKFGLQPNWFNMDFKKTKSYSDKLREISVYYKTFSNIFNVRTITSEYLIAMKLMAGRDYKHDLSDIVGIFYEQQEKGNPIKPESIKDAVATLYGSWENLPKDSIEFINMVYECNDYKALFFKIKNEEEEAREILATFSKDNPKVITRENINTLVKQLRKKINPGNDVG